MHAAFLLPDMGAGGAERLTIDLMAGFRQRGARVDLVLQQCRGEFLSLIPDGVRIFDLAAPRLRQAIGPLRAYLRAERPQALLAGMWPLTSVAQLTAIALDEAPRLVLSEHCSLRQQYAGQPVTLAKLRASLQGYRLADAVVAVSDGLAREIAGLSGLPQAKVTTIHNPIDPPLHSGYQPWPERSGPRILSVGNLKPSKNFALLIEAFARAARQRAMTLAIVGEGPLRPRLEAQVAALGLDGRVLLPGFTETPGDWYRDADLFALSSDYEGFGNVLVEAMHCGLPVVATDCPYGPREALGQGQWGRLVPPNEPDALADAILAELAAPRNSGAQRARADQFRADRAVAAYWRTLFE